MRKVTFVTCIFTQYISMEFICKKELCKYVGFSLSRSHITFHTELHLVRLIEHNEILCNQRAQFYCGIKSDLGVHRGYQYTVLLKYLSKFLENTKVTHKL